MTPDMAILLLLSVVDHTMQSHDVKDTTGDLGVASNSRPTGTAAAVLLVLLAAEGATVGSARSLLNAHVFIGMLLVPPILVKPGSTGWRFVRYYRRAPANRRKGPPPLLLGLAMLGPTASYLGGRP